MQMEEAAEAEEVAAEDAEIIKYWRTNKWLKLLAALVKELRERTGSRYDGLQKSFERNRWRS